MFTLGLTSDSPIGWCKVSEIKNELYNFEKEVFPKYKDKFHLKLWICFRCLPENYGRNSMRRFFKQDNALGMDMLITEEQMRPFRDGKYFPLTKVEQRLIMGEKLYGFLTETLENYRNKLAGIKEYGESFLEDTKNWLISNYWLSKDNSLFDLSVISFMSLEKAVEIFGKSIEKKVYTENNKKVQEFVWHVDAERKLRAKYVLSNGIWIFTEYKEE